MGFDFWKNLIGTSLQTVYLFMNVKLYGSTQSFLIMVIYDAKKIQLKSYRSNEQYNHVIPG